MNDRQLNDLPPIAAGQPPSGYFVLTVAESAARGPDLATLLRIIRSDWVFIVVTGIVFAVSSAGVSLTLSNEYEASILVAPVASDEEVSIGKMSGALGALAGLADFDFGSRSDAKVQALATLRSKGFAREFIESKSLMPVLFENEWITRVAAWWTPENGPTLDDGVKKFTTDVLRIIEDKRTGLVTVSVRWYSPELAAAWANQFVASVNARLRQEAIRDADKNINYLSREAERTESVEIRRSIYRLLEAQVNNAMLANVRPDYAFKVIDAARAPDPKNKVAPRRAILAISGSVLGMILATIIVLWRRRELLHSPAMSD
jgi:capsular polysaccharide biosynthesis protein